MTDKFLELSEYFYTNHKKGWVLVQSKHNPLLVVNRPVVGSYRFNWLTDYPSVTDTDSNAMTITFVAGESISKVSLVSYPKGINTLVDFKVTKLKLNGDLVEEIIPLLFRNGVAVITDLESILKINDTDDEYYPIVNFTAEGKYKELIPLLNVSTVFPIKDNTKFEWLYEERYVVEREYTRVKFEIPHDQDTILRLASKPKDYNGIQQVFMDRYRYGSGLLVDTQTMAAEFINGEAMVTTSLQELAIIAADDKADILVFRLADTHNAPILTYEINPPPATHVPKFELTSTMYKVNYDEKVQMNVAYVKRGSFFDVVVRNTNGLYTGTIDVRIPNNVGTNDTIVSTAMLNGLGIVKEIDLETKEYYYNNKAGMLYSSPTGQFVPLMLVYEGYEVVPIDATVPVDDVVKFFIYPRNNAYTIETEKAVTFYGRNDPINLVINTDKPFTGRVTVYRDDYSFEVDVVDGVGVILPEHHKDIQEDSVVYRIADKLTLPLEIRFSLGAQTNTNTSTTNPTYLVFSETSLPTNLGG